MSVVPGHGIFWCRGPCGEKEICPDLIFNDGYCLKPLDRIAAVKRDVKILEKEKGPEST